MFKRQSGIKMKSKSITQDFSKSQEEYISSQSDILNFFRYQALTMWIFWTLKVSVTFLPTLWQSKQQPLDFWLDVKGHFYVEMCQFCSFAVPRL